MRIAVSRKWCIFFGKKLIQFSRNLAKMIWWHSKQREKWESQNKLFSCVSALVLTITSATQKKLFCHQWILTRFRDEKLTSFQKIATKLNLFCINSSVHKYASTGSKYLYGGGKYGTGWKQYSDLLTYLLLYLLLTLLQHITLYTMRSRSKED